MAQIILDSANNVIQGDFDTATLSLRTRMQTSTTNATTGVYVVPNGSATSASIQMANAADPTNASKLVVATNGSTDTQIVSGANGTGTYLPLSFYTNNDIRFQMGTAGELNVRTAPGTVSSGSSGQVLTSGGPGAGVSWSAVSSFTNMQVFASPGTFTTPSTTTKIKVTVVGSGGNGGTNVGSGATGGGGGGAAIYVGPVTASTSYPVTVGSAPGGTSSFGALASATGGANGSGLTSSGSGGAGSAGTLQVKGSGGGGIPGSTGGNGGGAGGNSLLGGGAATAGPGTSGIAGGNYGGGGSGGGVGNPIAGGAGAGGVVIVEY